MLDEDLKQQTSEPKLPPIRKTLSFTDIIK
jgi:hypothetical protein